MSSLTSKFKTFNWNTISSNPTIDQWYSHTITVEKDAITITNGILTFAMLGIALGMLDKISTGR